RKQAAYPGCAAAVAPGRRTEHACVLARELRDALVTHREGRRSRIVALVEHQPPGFDQAQPLLILPRRERGELLEVLVERGQAHRRGAGEPFDRDAFAKGRSQQVDRASQPGGAALWCGYGAKLCAM